jgi:hypothetical protein
MYPVTDDKSGEIHAEIVAVTSEKAKEPVTWHWESMVRAPDGRGVAQEVIQLPAATVLKEPPASMVIAQVNHPTNST